MAAPWYDPNGPHVQVPALPYSEDIRTQSYEEILRERYGGDRTGDAAKAMWEYYVDSYQLDSPLKEYIGYVWKPEEAEELGMVAVPKIQFRVMARAPFEAKSAVIAHFGDGYASSLWNEEDRKRKR